MTLSLQERWRALLLKKGTNYGCSVFGIKKKIPFHGYSFEKELLDDLPKSKGTQHFKEKPG